MTTGASISHSDCGSVLSPVPSSEVQAPEGWILCHLTNPEGDEGDTPCTELLVGLRGDLNAESLLESGNTITFILKVIYPPSYSMNNFVTNKSELPQDGAQVFPYMG